MDWLVKPLGTLPFHGDIRLAAAECPCDGAWMHCTLCFFRCWGRDDLDHQC